MRTRSARAGRHAAEPTWARRDRSFHPGLYLTILLAITCAPAGTRKARAECYAITNVGTVAGATDLQVRDINNAGEIVGWALANNVYQGFYYSNGVMLSLGVVSQQNRLLMRELWRLQSRVLRDDERELERHDGRR